MHAQTPDGEHSAPTLQFLRFALEQELCAVRIDAVREILEVGQMTPLPLMPSFVRGVMNLRGAVVPVIDLGARLGLPPTTVGRRTCVVIVDVPDQEQQGHHTLGVLVDAVHEVFDTRSVDLEAVPRLGTRIRPEFIRHMVRVRGQATPDLDLRAILDHNALAELIGAHSLAAMH
ncbi:purine-binding chemotaxis protein CheW [Sphaerotilus hippei]|uniref:Purine-binding chemotaxis protein CheW n=1 Tax=Sphaerotilus hippei TaxID=744406 RepID=A0A318HAA4_9BURK|nr:chemotaxis protein CheW [Sphaerotilus hippei]PXW95505.1 purine-binding chemotaxis protein CheW [Sphaerotilus hippei]